MDDTEYNPEKNLDQKQADEAMKAAMKAAGY